MRKKRFHKGSWGELLQLCLLQGKGEVLTALEIIQQQTENHAAFLYSEEVITAHARRVRTTSIQQLETIIRLRNMTDEDIVDALKKAEQDGYSVKWQKAEQAA